jgi:N-acylglucosamine 2-epimerase
MITRSREAFAIEGCRDVYRHTLLEDVVPFWMRHGIDWEYGGISNVLDDAGNALSHDKYLWSQGRALWTFSALWNRVEHRREWLDFADHLYRYLVVHGRDGEGRWMYRLDPRGRVLDRDISIYVDGFVMHGLAEYYLATGNAAALELALQTGENIARRLRSPGSYGIAPYEIPPGMKAYGINMIFSFFFHHLGQAAGRADIVAEGMRLGREILEQFYDPVHDAILEFIGVDGRPVNNPPGRACVPGHCIEGLWFLISMFEQEDEPDRIAECCRLIRRHIELGWDPEFGGVRLGLDVGGVEPVYWKKADCRAWWVHCETLVATAYAHRHTGADWCREWHRRVREYAFAHYPMRGGEWTQWLDRQGRKMASAGLPVKDPFHLPRALIYLLSLCR